MPLIPMPPILDQAAHGHRTVTDPLTTRSRAHPCPLRWLVRRDHLNALATLVAPDKVSRARCSLDDHLLKLEDYLCPSTLHNVSGYFLDVCPSVGSPLE